MARYRGGWVGGGGAGQGWIGIQRWVKPSFGTVWASYGPQRCQPEAQTCLNGIRDISPSLGEYLPSRTPHGSHCLSHAFTGSAKLALEKQTSPPSLVIALCMCSVQVWPLAGPIKWNRPSVTIWSLFQNPVTIIVSLVIHPW